MLLFITSTCIAHMTLSHNGIKSLGPKVFFNNKQMEALDIGDNGMTMISPDAFQGLHKLSR